MVAAIEEIAGCQMPRVRHEKLLNWRTSQADRPLDDKMKGGLAPVVTALGGRLVFTGDWCVESSYEGCYRASVAAATAAKEAIVGLRTDT